VQRETQSPLSPRRGEGQGEGAVEPRICLATVRGREHARLGKNNQDAGAGCRENGATAIVVADGCGEGAFSEVGARLIARFVSQKACSATPEETVDALVAWLRGLSLGPQFVQEQLLSTFLCAVARPGDLTVFGIGDGLVYVDGALRLLEAGPDNAPPYVAYRLLDLEAPLIVHHRGPAKRLAIGTDGAHGLELESCFGWTNEHALQRRLNLTAGLHDDCTLALMELA
jgi:hypothetical protein